MGVIDKVKDFIGMNDDEYEDEYDDEDFEETKYEKGPEKIETYAKKNNVIKVHSNTDMKVFISEPTKYEDCTKAVDELRNRKVVVLNIEGLEVEAQKQIFEFIKGAVYSLEASIQKISRGIFVIAPNNVQIDGRLTERYEKNFYFTK